MALGNSEGILVALHQIGEVVVEMVGERPGGSFGGG